MRTYKKEADVKKEIDKALKAAGAYVVMYVPVGFGKAGVPDYVVCVGGLFLGIEAKLDAKKNPPTKLQQYNMVEIKNAGGLACVVDKSNVEDLPQILKYLQEDYIPTGAKEVAVDNYSAVQVKSPLLED